MTIGSITLRARYILPVEGAAIPDGRITIEAGRITAIGGNVGRATDLDLGDVAILPGFVNAHTHLELGLIDRASSQPEDEVTWLSRVIAQRRDCSRDVLADNVRANVNAILRAGTTLVADTTTVGLSWPAIAGAPMRGVVFSEILGLSRMRGVQTDAEAWDWLSTITLDDQIRADCRPGLSPHAPYSTAGWLYHKAALSGLPLSTHLAEMPEELELLQYGTGGLRRFLEDLGAWDPAWEPIGPNPADYVRKGDLRKAHWLIAHGTYLSPSDFWQLRPDAAPNGQRVAIAFCPRTHARFGHARHPFREMIERGIAVCLGTDSLASAPTLGVLDEARFLAKQDDALPGQLLLTMATLSGAWALHADNLTGSLKVGKSADLAVVALPGHDDGNPYDLVMQTDLPVLATMFAGKFVRGPWES